MYVEFVNKQNVSGSSINIWRLAPLVALLILAAIGDPGWAGSLVAWGRDNYGQVSNTPAGNDFAAIASGRYHNVALKSDGSLVAWGEDNYGSVSNTPSGNDFAVVSAGSEHNVALKSDGSLIAWGYDGDGQVSNTPAGNDFAAVSAGSWHSVALKSDGSLVAWGLDRSGVVSNTPAGNDFAAVSAGYTHNVALKSDGSLVTWGWDYYGQVSNTPAGNDFAAVSAGRRHSVALKSDGSLVTWGWDYYGQVSNTPAGNDFAAVSAGSYHNVALKSDGSLVAWGDDGAGQVSNTPAGNDFAAIASGRRHSVAISAASEGPPTLSDVTDAGNATADLTWQPPANIPQYHVACAWDIYTGQWVDDFSAGSDMWYWFEGTDQSGQMNLGRSGAYHVWISSYYDAGSLYPCNNPWTGIIYNGKPHQPINVTAENLGSRQVKVSWKPDIYGTWVYWLIAYKNDAPNQGWLSVQGPLGDSFWHYTAYGASEATLTMPYDGDYWLYLFAHGWDDQWSDPAAVFASP